MIIKLVIGVGGGALCLAIGAAAIYFGAISFVGKVGPRPPTPE